MEDGRDLVWDAIVTVAERMNQRYEGSALEIAAHRERSLTQWSVTEGLHAGDDWTGLRARQTTAPVRKAVARDAASSGRRREYRCLSAGTT